MASKRADVGSILEVRMEVSEAMFRDCYVKPAEGKGANLNVETLLASSLSDAFDWIGNRDVASYVSM